MTQRRDNIPVHLICANGAEVGRVARGGAGGQYRIPRLVIMLVTADFKFRLGSIALVVHRHGIHTLGATAGHIHDHIDAVNAQHTAGIFIIPFQGLGGVLKSHQQFQFIEHRLGIVAVKHRLALQISTQPQFLRQRAACTTDKCNIYIGSLTGRQPSPNMVGIGFSLFQGGGYIRSAIILGVGTVWILPFLHLSARESQTCVRIASAFALRIVYKKAQSILRRVLGSKGQRGLFAFCIGNYMFLGLSRTKQGTA